MAQDWTGGLNYWCPPVELIDRVLIKVEAERARGLLVVPFWPHAHWWPALERVACDRRHLSWRAFEDGIGGPAERPKRYAERWLAVRIGSKPGRQ